MANEELTFHFVDYHTGILSDGKSAFQIHLVSVADLAHLQVVAEKMAQAKRRTRKQKTR